MENVIYTGPLLAITGPTASGKTRKGVAAADLLNGEIISTDSRQVYRDMDLGTGKDLEDYLLPDGKELPYHLIDIRPAGYHYNLQEFLHDSAVAEADIRSRGKLPVYCGGTGMYLEVALSGISLPAIPRNDVLRKKLEGKSLEELTAMLGSLKKLHNVTDTDTTQRAVREIEIETYYRSHPEADKARNRTKATPKPHILIALELDRELRRKKITDRLRKRFTMGMTAEVERLLDRGVKAEDLIYYGLEYKYITLFVTGAISRQEMERNLEIAIHQFAKRQMTWIRGMERRGFIVNWLPATMDDTEFAYAAANLLRRKLNKEQIEQKGKF